MKKVDSVWNLDFKINKQDYWVVECSFNSSVYRIFKSRKNALSYFNKLKNYILSNVENIVNHDKEKEEGDIVLGFWHTTETTGSRYELRLFKVEK